MKGDPDQMPLTGTFGRHELEARAFLLDNPRVVGLMVRFARQAKGRGMRRYGIAAIFERVRWFYHVEKGQRDFKLNNNWRATVARYLMRKYPDLDGFFETRQADIRRT